MDAIHEFPHLDTRRDALACAALLLAMVIGAACAAFVIDFEAGAAAVPAPVETRAHCPAHGISIH